MHFSGSAVSCGTSTHPNGGINVSNQDWNSIVDAKKDAFGSSSSGNNDRGADISSSFMRSHYSPYTMSGEGPQQAGIEPTRSEKLFFFLL